ncbi:MAG TPA: CopD family protein [Solirubrobacteraceae bacterium]|nr:CopD family protein [Solirubrobacteraceae bacterium]
MTRIAGIARPSTARAAAVTLLALVALLVHAAPALAHAQLLGTSPQSGSTVARQPPEVIFEFNQNVGGTLGAVRVYDAAGNEVDNLRVAHSDGNQHWMGVGLKPGLPDGTYTATYRVISADTHIVYGGLVFNIGHAGAAPKVSVAGLISRGETGEVTKLAFGAVRFLDYVSIALFVGGLAFAWLAWGPALGSAPAGRRWADAAARGARTLGLLLALGTVLGLLVSILGVLLQGASAAGVSLWSSLKATVLESTLESRFGEVWTARAGVWLLIALALIGARALGVSAVPRLQARDAPSAPERVVRPPALLVAILSLACAYVVITPALAGHPSVQGPRGVFFPSDVLHVLAASVWVGGIASLLIAVPAATRRLQGEERTELLLGTLARFSRVALASVVAIGVTGVVQAYIDVRSLDALVNTTYGVLVLTKSVLFLGLVTFGWMNRERLIPALRRLVAAGSTPGRAGVLGRRTLRGELALMAVVFGVTAALVAEAPPIDAATGPFSTNTKLGAAELEMTVEPARVGPNTVHLYLIDARTGAPFTATKELTANAKLPAKDIGPLQLKPTLAGPGHYILNSAVLSPGGTWELTIVDRVSEFESSSRVVKVSIR